jgi:L-asparagine transporter-like permease
MEDQDKMKKFPSNLISIMFYTIFVVSTIISLFIVYKDIDNSFAFKFVIGYVVFLMLFLFYFIVATVINMRKLKWFDIRKKMYRFISSFVLLSGTSIIYYYFFRPAEIDYYRIFSIALGLSLGIAFLNLAFSRKKNVD